MAPNVVPVGTVAFTSTLIIPNVNRLSEFLIFSAGSIASRRKLQKASVFDAIDRRFTHASAHRSENMFARLYLSLVFGTLIAASQVSAFGSSRVGHRVRLGRRQRSHHALHPQCVCAG